MKESPTLLGFPGTFRLNATVPSEITVYLLHVVAQQCGVAGDGAGAQADADMQQCPTKS